MQACSSEDMVQPEESQFALELEHRQSDPDSAWLESLFVNDYEQNPDDRSAGAADKTSPEDPVPKRQRVGGLTGTVEAEDARPHPAEDCSLNGRQTKFKHKGNKRTSCTSGWLVRSEQDITGSCGEKCFINTVDGKQPCEVPIDDVKAALELVKELDLDVVLCRVCKALHLQCHICRNAFGPNAGTGFKPALKKHMEQHKDHRQKNMKSEAGTNFCEAVYDGNPSDTALTERIAAAVRSFQQCLLKFLESLSSQPDVKVYIVRALQPNMAPGEQERLENELRKMLCAYAVPSGMAKQWGKLQPDEVQVCTRTFQPDSHFEECIYLVFPTASHRDRLGHLHRKFLAGQLGTHQRQGLPSKVKFSHSEDRNVKLPPLEFSKDNDRCSPDKAASFVLRCQLSSSRTDLPLHLAVPQDLEGVITNFFANLDEKEVEEMQSLIRSWSFKLTDGSIHVNFNVPFTRRQSQIMMWLFQHCAEARQALEGAGSLKTFGFLDALPDDGVCYGFSRLSDGLVTQIYKHAPECVLRDTAVCRQFQRCLPQADNVTIIVPPFPNARVDLRVLRSYRGLMTLKLDTFGFKDIQFPAKPQFLSRLVSLSVENVDMLDGPAAHDQRATSPASNLERLEKLIAFARVQELTLRNIKVGDAECARIARILPPWLTRLDLARCQMGDKGLGLLSDALGAASQLTALNVSGNLLQDTGLHSLLTSVQPSIRHLDASYNEVASVPAEQLARLTSLRELSLAENGVGSEQLVHILDGLKNCSHLTSLNVSSSVLPRSCVGACLTWVREMSAVQLFNGVPTRCGPSLVYDVRGSPVRAFEMDLMKAILESTPSLRALRLSSCSMEDDVAALLGACLGRLPALRVLDLFNNRIGSEGAKCVAKGLSGCKSLEYVYMLRNCIGIAGVKALVQVLCGTKAVLDLVNQRRLEGRSWDGIDLLCNLTQSWSTRTRSGDGQEASRRAHCRGATRLASLLARVCDAQAVEEPQTEYSQPTQPLPAEDRTQAQCGASSAPPVRASKRKAGDEAAQPSEHVKEEVRAEEATAHNAWRVGDEVEGWYPPDGEWYPARIQKKLPNGKYRLLWDDRDPLHRVRTGAQLRTPQPELETPLPDAMDADTTTVPSSADAQHAGLSRVQRELEIASPGVRCPGVWTQAMGRGRRTRGGRVHFTPESGEPAPPTSPEEDAGTAFKIPKDGSFGQKALKLIDQLDVQLQVLSAEFEGEVLEWASTEDGGSDRSTLERLRSEAQSCKLRLKDIMEVAKRVVALVGGNGDGKSSTLNFLLQATEWAVRNYGVNGGVDERYFQDNKTTDDALRDWLFDHLEGVRDLLKLIERGRREGNPDAASRAEQKDRQLVHAALSFVPEQEVRPDSHYRSKEELEAARKCAQAIVNVHEKTPNKEDKKGFWLMPSSGEGDSTTRVNVRLSQGSVYHMLVVYKSEEEVVRELLDFPWDQLQEDEDEDEESSEEDEEDGKGRAKPHDDTKNAKLKREMLLRVSGVQHPAKVKDEDLPIPHCREDIKFCPAVQERLNRGFDIVAGRAQMPIDDRLHVREQLLEVATKLQFACIVKECCVYAPADALEGIDFLDLPGCGTNTSPLEEANLRIGAQGADGILVVQQRHLGCNAEVQEELDGCGVLERMLREPDGDKQLFVFTALNEATSTSDLNGFLDNKTTFHETKEERREQNQAALTEWLGDVRKRMVKEGQVPKQPKAQREAEIERIVRRVPSFSGYPMLWTSLKLSRERLKHNQGAVACLEAMGDIDQLLRELRRWATAPKSASERHVVAGMREALGALFEPKNEQQPPVDSSAMSESMRELAQQESMGVWKPRAREALEQMVQEMFDTDVYIPWNRKYGDFVEKVDDAMDRMMEKLDAKAITAELNRKLKGHHSTWRSLQNAFDTQLQGNYKRVPLFKIFFSKMKMPQPEQLEASLQTLKAQLVPLLRSCLENLIKCKLSGSRTQARALPQGLCAMIEQAVAETVPDVAETEGPRETRSTTAEEALGLLNRSLSRKRVWSRAKAEEACRQSLVDNLLKKMRARPADGAKQDRRKREGKLLCEKYMAVVEENAHKVVEAVPKILSEDISTAVEQTMQEVKSRFVQRRGRARRPPTFLRLYRQAFRTLLHLVGQRRGGEEEELDADESEKQVQAERAAHELVTDFLRACSDLEASHAGDVTDEIPTTVPC